MQLSLICQIIERWTSERFLNEMLQQDFKGKYISEPQKLAERHEYWTFRIRYLEGRPDNFNLFTPFIIIANFPVEKLKIQHKVEHPDLVKLYEQDIKTMPPIFIIYNNYMVSQGEQYPQVINGHHRLAAAKSKQQATIKIVTDNDSWKNLKDLC